MINVVLGRDTDAVMTRVRLRKMHELRYEVFHEKLKWRVDGTNRQERDEYDQLSPYYMIALDGEKASGCWRLLPTAEPYMLSNTFSNLLKGECAPERADVWELSRFAVVSPARRYNGQIHLSETAFEMFYQLIRFADARRITHYVTVVSTAVEKLMIKNGICLQRFGDGTTTSVDGIKSVACWIPLNRQTREAVTAGLQLTRMELSAIA